MSKYITLLLKIIQVAFSSWERILISISVVFLLSTNLYLLVSIKKANRNIERIESRVEEIEAKYWDLASDLEYEQQHKNEQFENYRNQIDDIENQSEYHDRRIDDLENQTND